MATFKEKFFTELYKHLAVHGTVYVVEDGNMYLKQKQAEARVASSRKLAAINGDYENELRYAVTTVNNPPTSADDLEKLFEEQEAIRRKKARSEAEKAAEGAQKLMSDAEAQAALDKIKKGAKTGNEEQTTGDVMPAEPTEKEKAPRKSSKNPS